MSSQNSTLRLLSFLLHFSRENGRGSSFSGPSVCHTTGTSVQLPEHTLFTEDIVIHCLIYIYWLMDNFGIYDTLALYLVKSTLFTKFNDTLSAELSFNSIFTYFVYNIIRILQSYKSCIQIKYFYVLSIFLLTN